ncbi:hypothetical protein T4C_8406 [Trichinella pseudospiralis]|uniref:Uncharacterized protein n=1 Tax=Trichinella pseudospiralis TaxID=6337 RepID=A0A0V1JIR4_TRIPS|nr:hypothetical protein T4C_8406 [Trichinella pseudospiralis]
MECNDAKWNGSMEYVYSEQRHNTALDMATLTMECKCIKRTVVFLLDEAMCVYNSHDWDAFKQKMLQQQWSLVRRADEDSSCRFT